MAKKIVKTRSGKEVEILTMNGKNPDRPIEGVMKGNKKGSTLAYRWHKDGRWHAPSTAKVGQFSWNWKQDHPNDLML